MELVFFWCEEYFSLKNKSFNFNPRFHITYENNELKIEEKDVVNIFGNGNNNILNVTAIVGENGSGKTSLIKAVIDSFFAIKKLSEWNKEYLVIYYKNESNKLYVYENIKEVAYPEKWRGRLNINKNEDIDTMGIIYHSNAFNGFDYKNDKFYKCDKLFNLEMMDNIRECARHRKEMHEDELYADPIVVSLQNETKIQLQFLSSRKENALFKVRNLIITCMNKNNFTNALPARTEKSANEKIKQIFSQVRRASNDGSLNFIIEATVYLIIRMIIPQTVGAKNNEKNEFFKKTLEELGDDIKNIKDEIKSEELRKRLIDLYRKNIKNIRITTKDYKEMSRSYDKVISFFLKRKDEFNNYTNRYEMLINEDSKEVLEFYDAYQKTTFRLWEYMNFEWGMSSGELAYLGLYSKLYSLKTKITGDPSLDSIIIILDEADLYFHPRWQQMFIKKFIDNVSDFYGGKMKLQLIIATHSPIFLSDIPQEHVICLGNGEINKQTFAANIYNLYNSAFFFEKDQRVGIIGDYANGKIVNVAKELRTINDEIAFLNWINKLEEDIDNKLEDEKNEEIKALMKKTKRSFFILFENLIETSGDIAEIAKDFNEKLEHIYAAKFNGIVKNVKDEMKSKFGNENLKQKIGRIQKCKEIINLIGENVVKDELMSLYKSVEDKLSEMVNVDKEEREKIKEVNMLLIEFEKLTSEQQKSFVEEIVLKNKLSGKRS